MINNNPSQPQVTKSGVLLYLTNSKKTKYMQFAFMQSKKKSKCLASFNICKGDTSCVKKTIICDGGLAT